MASGSTKNLAFNPRFANYARVHGRTPEAQLDHDRAAWPNASMLPFTEWNGDRIVEFSKEHPEAFTAGGLSDHGAYDAWLNARPTESK